MARTGPKPLPEAERFFRYVHIDDVEKCWPWRGRKAPNGYGHFARRGGGETTAHRAAYDIVIGKPVPDGWVIDHAKCDNRECVNPYHLEATTQQRNILRGTSLSARRARQTECLNGHSLSGDNLMVSTDKDGVHRRCRACQRIRDRARR